MIKWNVCIMYVGHGPINWRRGSYIGWVDWLWVSWGVVWEIVICRDVIRDSGCQCHMNIWGDYFHKGDKVKCSIGCCIRLR